MSPRFDDLAHEPPADLSTEERGLYEDALVRELRRALRPGTVGTWIIESVELEDSWPDTKVVFTYREGSGTNDTFVSRAVIWSDIVHEVDGRPMLESIASVGGSIFSALTAGELPTWKVSSR